MTYPERLAIAIDQLLNTLFGGWPDETFSARCQRMAPQSAAWRATRRAVNALFFFQHDHCAQALASEIERKHSPRYRSQ